MNPRCPNCETELLGEYCHACGQRQKQEDELTIGHALRTWSDDVLHLESRTLRSMAALFEPGRLTADYLDGRRVRFTSPVKLYLACAAVFFLCAPLAGFTLEQILASDTAGTLSQVVESEIRRTGLDRRLFAERFDLRFQTVYTALLVVSMLGGSAMLAFLFRRQRRPFGAHVVFELHYVSFLYLITIVLGVILRFAPPLPLLSLGATLAVLAPYMFVAQRRVYRESRTRIFLKTAAMILFALVFDNFVNFLALVLTLRLV